MNNFVTPAPHNSVRKSVIKGTLDHIQHKPRSLNSYDPIEDFLNERSIISFDDTARSIRAHTAALLKKVHAPVPKSIKPLVLSSLYNNYKETPISERITSDEYITHLLRPLPGKKPNGIDVSYYPESTNVHLGKTHLACLTYAGDHAIPRRRHLMVAGAGDDDLRNVRSDVEMLSHYTRMRQAANADYHKGDDITKQNCTTNGTSEQSSPKEDGPIPNGHVDEDTLDESLTFTVKKRPSLSSKDVKINAEDYVGDNKEKRPSLKKIKKSSTKDVSFDETSITSEREKYKTTKKQQSSEDEERQRLRKQSSEEAEEKRKNREELERKQRELEDRLAEEYRREQELKLEQERRLQEKLAEERILAEQLELEEKLRKVKEEQEMNDDINEEITDDDVFESEQRTAASYKRKSVNDEFDWGEIENNESQNDEQAEVRKDDYEQSDDEPAVAEETIRSNWSRRSKSFGSGEEKSIEVRDSSISRTETISVEKSRRIGGGSSTATTRDSEKAQSETGGAAAVADDKTDNTEVDADLSENEAEPLVDEPVTPDKETAQKQSFEVEQVSSDEEASESK